MAAGKFLEGRERPLVMAHRGNSARCPENTMAAFRQALAEGVDIIETDLHLSADGVFMCIHDATVDRTTDGTGAVAEMTLDTLKTLRASYGQAAFADEVIPTLAELLDILPDEVAVALELKTDAFLREDVCLRLRALLLEEGALYRTAILSFNREHLRAVKQFIPEVLTGLISMTNILPEAEWAMTGSFWPMMFLNPFYTSMAHKKKQFVCPLDPTPDSRLWFYKLTDCDAVLTNDPAQTRRALGRS